MTREEIINGLKSVKEELHKILTNPYAGVYQTIDEVIKALEQEPCEDCISRSELLKALDTWDKFGYRCAKFEKLDSVTEKYFVPYIHYDDVKKAIKGMSSIQPKPKTGRWIYNKEIGSPVCSECGGICLCLDYYYGPLESNYCPTCGAKMVKPQESEK